MYVVKGVAREVDRVVGRLVGKRRQGRLCLLHGVGVEVGLCVVGVRNSL